MQLVNIDLEKRALKTVCNGSKEVSAILLSQLTTDHFSDPVCNEAYKRVLQIIKDRGETLTWEDICSDPAIKEVSRQELKEFKKKPYKTTARAEKTIKTLLDYFKLRKLLEGAENISNAVQQPKVNINKLLDQTSDLITAVKVNVNQESLLTHIGDNDKENGLDIVDQVLEGSATNLIPTGFKAFDSINRGIPKGGLFTVAATTGGGKTTMTLQLARNMAEYGARVCVVSLEMSEQEIMMRRIANLTRLPMTKLIDPEQLTIKEKQTARKIFKDYHHNLRKKGSLETYMVPDQDMTIEQILYSLKPHLYDAIFIDYIGLLKGVDGDDQWRQLSNAARFGKRFASINDTLVVLCAQLGDEGVIRYSRAIKEHSSHMWTWCYNEKSKETHVIEVEQQKARNQRAFTFRLHEDFETMSLRDLETTEDDEYQQHFAKNSKKGSSDNNFKVKKSKGRNPISESDITMDLDDLDLD